MHDLQHIYPLQVLLLDNGQLNLYFSAEIQYELFEDNDKEASGFNWIDIIELYIEDNFPDLLGEFEYEPEREVCSLTGEYETIKAFILEFYPFVFNDSELDSYIKRL